MLYTEPPPNYHLFVIDRKLSEEQVDRVKEIAGISADASVRQYNIMLHQEPFGTLEEVKKFVLKRVRPPWILVVSPEQVTQEVAAAYEEERQRYPGLALMVTI